MRSSPCLWGRIYPAVVVFLAAATWGALDSKAGEATEFRTSTLRIIGNGIPHIFSIEIADTPALRERGLMFRRELPTDHGMLLRYPEPQLVNIWMKDTYIPLDIIFIDESGRIIRVIPDAAPLSETIMPSGEAVRAVLEIQAGRAKALGIKEGDQAIYKQ